MPNFEFIDDTKPHYLVPDDCIIHQDKFWRIVQNYSVLGYPAHCRRMLVLVPHQFDKDARGFKFLEITSEARIAAYRKTE